MRRLLLAAGLGLAAGIAVLLTAGAAGTQLRPELCAGIGTAAAMLMQLVRETAAIPPPVPEPLEPAAEPGNTYLSRLRQLERRLEAASTDGAKYDRNVRPLLARLAADRLRRRHGISLGRQPGEARQALGEQLWSMTIAPPAEDSPAPSRAELSALIARIEAL